MHVTYISPFDRVLSTYQRQCGSLETSKMHRASVFGSGYTLFGYRGLEEGETGLGCIVRKERVRGERAERLKSN